MLKKCTLYYKKIMLQTLKINNFRGLKSFELQQLGRVNLLVGTNNSGKTSILEAIQLLCSPNNLEPLLETMTSRGEFSCNDDNSKRIELDVSYLFDWDSNQSECEFSIEGVKDRRKIQVVASIGEIIANRELNEKSDTRNKSDSMGNAPGIGNDSPVGNSLDDLKELAFTVEWTGSPDDSSLRLPLSSKRGLPVEYIRRLRINTKKSAVKTQFVTSSSLTTNKMIELFDQLVLTPEEELVEKALQTIDPQIERIASVSLPRIVSSSSSDSRGGFVVRLSGSTQRVPIGSMGDGIWRMLGLALATVCAKDGVLLVDEIDTGLHFTTMSDIWKLIWDTAKRLNVQVFATTHNSDCWTSLASIASREDAAEDGITIQRIEKGKGTSVAFTEREIVIAAERGIEVR